VDNPSGLSPAVGSRPCLHTKLASLPWRGAPARSRMEGLVLRPTPPFAMC
jgi:hypothetical protein